MVIVIAHPSGRVADINIAWLKVATLSFAREKERREDPPDGDGDGRDGLVEMLGCRRTKRYHVLMGGWRRMRGAAIIYVSEDVVNYELDSGHSSHLSREKIHAKECERNH